MSLFDFVSLSLVSLSPFVILGLAFVLSGLDDRVVR